MSTIKQIQREWGGRELTFRTGKLAPQADAAIEVIYGETIVLCTVVCAKQPKENQDFFPLTVHFLERSYAGGKFPGGFFKRESKPSDKETLTARLIDRPIRALFPDDFRNETQVICKVLSYDGENDADILAVIGTAAALAISNIPFHGPLSCAKVALIDEELILNPTVKQLSTSNLDLVVAGTKDSVVMVESQAKELLEVEMLDAITFAHKEMQVVIEMIDELTKLAGNTKFEVIQQEIPESLIEEISNFCLKDLTEAYSIKIKKLRKEAIEHIKKLVIEKFVNEKEQKEFIVNQIFKQLEEKTVKINIIDKDLRIDGRANNEIRHIETEVGLLPRTHGSALFTRGETQALVVTTLGTADDAQTVDSLNKESVKEAFMLHYNFPPYSVGEASALKAPGRREIGHGKLALRAMQAVLPSKLEFPYTVRVVSEITSCNGSSSMATVCGASLSLMDAGVPIKSPVAGIAMGLVKEGDKFAIISDIIGDEDHFGDMDFKVAGTKEGITALQLDIKIEGIGFDIIRDTLNQAKAGRLHILSKMAESISESRTSINNNAPSITSITINRDKIREVIGSGGSVIKKICEVSGAKVDIEDDGTVRIAASNSKATTIALKMIEDITLEAEVDKVYDGKVVKIVEFGAFVNFLGSRDGLIHISELAEGRVEKVTDCLQEGDKVKVMVLGIDSRGKIKLSLRLVDQETGEILGKGNISSSSQAGSEGSAGAPEGGFDKPRRPRVKNSFPEKSERTEKRKYYN